MKIGVLAMQGAFLEHLKMLESLGVEGIEVRKSSQLDNIDGLIIPGGESTTIGRLLVKYGLLKPLKKKIADGFPVFGTCAGMIMLSNNVTDGVKGQPLLGGLDVVCGRNAYGRQKDSFEAWIDVPDLGKDPFPGVFIRAPLIKSTGRDVKIIATLGKDVVAVRQGNILAISFHPELTNDDRFHRYFIEMIRSVKKTND